MIRFIEAHRDSYGVERICRVLRIPPSTYYAARSRPASARARRDAELLVEILDIHRDSGGRFGARRVWSLLRERDRDVARCTVERLMRQAGLNGTSGSVLRGHGPDRHARGVAEGTPAS